MDAEHQELAALDVERAAPMMALRMVSSRRSGMGGLRPGDEPVGGRGVRQQHSASRLEGGALGAVTRRPRRGNLGTAEVLEDGVGRPPAAKTPPT